MKELNINEVPPEVRVRARTIELIFGWCFIVKDIDGKFSIHYNNMGEECSEEM